MYALVQTEHSALLAALAGRLLIKPPKPLGIIRGIRGRRDWSKLSIPANPVTDPSHVLDADVYLVVYGDDMVMGDLLPMVKFLQRFRYDKNAFVPIVN